MNISHSDLVDKLKKYYNLNNPKYNINDAKSDSHNLGYLLGIAEVINYIENGYLDIVLDKE